MTRSRYPVPAGWYRHETEVKHSRFIATICPTADREQSEAFVQQIRHEFANANHNCWARVIGAPGCTTQAGMSDDGEPQGAAGKPMLTALLHAPVGDITVVVSRYFGGTRLGKGGMARAYTDAVLQALERLPLREKISLSRLQILCDYSWLASIQYLLADYEATIDATQYSDCIQIELSLPREHAQRFSLHLSELSHGRIAIRAQPLDNE
ncbi:MAG: YigZ family protein [Desulfuromonadaceae bacterium]|nr:YigZ family protein [Desulfuromonadaceae bacterium]